MALYSRIAMLLVVNLILGLGLFGVICEERKNYIPVACFSTLLTLLIVTTNPIV